MATVYHRKCLVDKEIVDPRDGANFFLQKGRVYSTTRSYKGQVRVLAAYWFWAPKEWFGRPKKLGQPFGKY